VVATDGYMIQITRTSVHQPGVIAMARALAELAARHDKFGCIAVVESGARLRLPADVREGHGALIKRCTHPTLPASPSSTNRVGFRPRPSAA
jgi:hypothetical protein